MKGLKGLFLVLCRLLGHIGSSSKADLVAYFEAIEPSIAEAKYCFRFHFFKKLPSTHLEPVPLHFNT